MNLTYESYSDKVLGGWLGKCAGGILGAPIEGIKAFNDIQLSEKLFEVNYPNDDLDLQVLWLDMVKKKGPSVRESDFGNYWLRHVGFPWNEYGIATRNLRMGIFPPDSGVHNNSYFGESMGCPIRSELWGLLNPGDPEKAAFYAGMDASLDHHGFSVDAEKFLSACAAIAFFEQDIQKIFHQALEVVSQSGTLFRLVENVIYWHANSGYKTARGKIKSYYGDADFTSAPMNVGFTLLTLLEKGADFQCVMDALHMGHDSDCIAATTGALAGIISGYKNIPQHWKKLVGDELVISKEIQGIEAPSTITELADQTCRAGINFIQAGGKVQLSGAIPVAFETEAAAYHITTSLLEDELIIKYENLSTKAQDVKLLFESDRIEFKKKTIAFAVHASDTFDVKNSFSILQLPEPHPQYSINIIIDSQKAGPVTRGIASYGSWLLIGPFIEDDKTLLDQHHPLYAEHGLASLPSVQYMNHDKVDVDKEFLDAEQLAGIAAAVNWDAFPFAVQRIVPSDFRIDLNQYYYGRGERTVYLLSHLYLKEEKSLWINIGCTSRFHLKINNKKIYTQQETQRAWPGNSIILHPFQKGKNTILLQLNLITDLNQLEIGFKDFTGNHPHQEQWSLEVPQV